MGPQKAISMNVKRIRASRGMNQTAAAKAVGISRQAFIAIENGKTKEPRVSNLQSIADAFDVEVLDLLAESPKLNTVRFRSNSIKTKKDKAKKEQYLINIAYWLRDFNFLQSVVDGKKEYGLKSVFDQIRQIETIRPERAAKLAREALDVRGDEQPIRDILDLMENAGIKMRTLSFDLEKFFGLSVSTDDGGPAIIVNSKEGITIERQIFTVAHELGHLLLHPAAYDPSETAESKQEEKEADAFASYFLMPQKAFKKKWEESYGLGFAEKVLHIKRFFGVSYLTVLYRLNVMGIADFRTLMFKFTANYEAQYDEALDSHKEPIPLAKSDFVEDYFRLLVRKALEKAEITISRAAEILNVPLMDMRKMINAWAEIAT